MARRDHPVRQGFRQIKNKARLWYKMDNNQMDNNQCESKADESLGQTDSALDSNKEHLTRRSGRRSVS